MGLLYSNSDKIIKHRDFSCILNQLKQLSIEKQISIIVAAQLSQGAKEYPYFIEADTTIRLNRESIFIDNIDINRIIESKVYKKDFNKIDRYYHHFITSN